MEQRPNTVAGLRELHREIAGQVEATRQTLNRLAADLEAVEHTILLLDPDASLPRAKPIPSQDAAMKGEMRKHVLSALRTAQGPLTSLDIARQVIEVRKLNPHATAMIRRRVTAALWKLKTKGWIVEVPLDGDYKGWRPA